LLALNGARPACDLQNGPRRIDLARDNPAHTPTKCENQALTPRPAAESDPAYPALQLNDRWRVIVCRDAIQWVLQRRDRPDRPERHAREDWRGRSYCRTREALIRCCDRYSGEIDPVAVAALRTLPDRIEPPSKRVITKFKAATEAETPNEVESLGGFGGSETGGGCANRLLERAGSHITFPDRQWHPTGQPATIFREIAYGEWGHA
jgi:hypothetical protein